MSSETTYLVRYDDTDPVVVYTGAWQTTFAGGTLPSMNGHTYGVGDSTHVAGAAGASLSFDFWGTELQLLGKADGASYTVSVDGGAPTVQHASGSSLASLNSLAPGKHSLKLVVTSPGTQFAFDQALFSVGTGFSGAIVSNLTFTNRDTAWTYDSAAWHSLGPLTMIPREGEVTLGTTNVDSPLSIQVQGFAVFLVGNAFADHDVYEVHLDEMQVQFSGKSENFIEDCTLFFYAGLDPSRSHTLWIINKTPGNYVDVDYVHVLQVQGGTPFTPGAPASSSTTTSSTPGTVSTPSASVPSLTSTSVPASVSVSVSVSYAPASVSLPGGPLQDTQSTGSTHHSSAGLIAGVVIAVVAALVIGGAFIFFFLRRRRRRQELDADVPDFSQVPAGQSTPFVLPPAPMSPISSTRPIKGASPPMPRVSGSTGVPSERGTSVAFSGSGTDTGSGAPLAPGDMERVLAFVASRLDVSSNHASNGEHAGDTAPPRYT